MVGLSDIPFVGKVVDRISDATVEGVFRGLGYVFLYKELVNDLNSEIGKLILVGDEVSGKADEENADGKIIEDHVLVWQNDVEKFRESVEEFLEIHKNKASWRCMALLPIPNPVSRFRLGREAVRKTKILIELIDSGEEILACEIAYYPPYETLPEADTAFLNFQSREDAYGKLWQALTAEGNSTILGIYGMPGVGKTRMAEQIWKDVLEQKIFDKVTKADVGNRELDVIHLQKQIASYLGLYLESEDNVERRASQLKNSLMDSGKILIILDDVWEEIPLDIIGIPFGNGSTCNDSKILLTSRKEYVCLRNNCKQFVKIDTLAANEAWDMFNNTVDAGTLDSLQEESLAKDVCTKCAGLPLVIRNVGRALQFKSENIWKYTLYRLENCEIESIGGIRGEVYKSLKLSFDNLFKDAASCLFLCSLYPEDADIPIRTLIQLATGSQLVTGGRSGVRALVDILKSSSLLLEGKDDEHVKLHAIVRMVARTVAVEDPECAFLFATCGLRLPDYAGYGTRKLLHLDLEKNDFHFPDDPVCPALHTLSLRSISVNKPNLFPQGIKLSTSMFMNLRFLVLVNFSWQQQFPFQFLGKLESLFLDHCDLTYFGETSVGFFPQSLEALGIGDCLLPKPLDLSNLKYLTKLEILCEVLFMPTTIHGLSRLEELHIPNGFEIQNGTIQRWTAILE